jgi:hypothetical protein
LQVKHPLALLLDILWPYYAYSDVTNARDVSMFL